VASNEERVSALQGILTSPKVNRWLPWAAGGILLVGLIVFLAVKYSNTAKTTETPISNQPAQTAAAPGKHVPLSANARAVASLFIQKAVTREDAALAYRLSGPDIRQGSTLASWTRDWNDPNVGVAIQPFPASKNAKMLVDYSTTNEAQLEFMLTRRPSAAAQGWKKQQLFIMVLDKIGGRWRVNYWAPREPPPVRVDPGQ
jgi:hypothetical protein